MTKKVCICSWKRTENNRDQLPQIIFQFTGKCSKTVKPGLKLSLYVSVFQNPTSDFGTWIIHESPPVKGLFGWRHHNNYLPTATCLKNTAFANSVSLIPLAAIIANLPKIYTECNRIISAHSFVSKLLETSYHYGHRTNHRGDQALDPVSFISHRRAYKTGVPTFALLSKMLSSSSFPFFPAVPGAESSLSLGGTERPNKAIRLPYILLHNFYLIEYQLITGTSVPSRSFYTFLSE